MTWKATPRARAVGIVLSLSIAFACLAIIRMGVNPLLLAPVGGLAGWFIVRPVVRRLSKYSP